MLTKRNIYLIKDDVVGCYSPMVNLFDNDMEALRAFKTAFVNGLLKDVKDNPGDYHIYKVGSLDLETGAIVAKAPELVGHFISFVGGAEDGR